MSVLDPKRNFAIVTFAAGFAAGATSATLIGGDGAKLPPTSEGAFNLAVWDDSSYPSAPYSDPSVEIIRVTTRATDTLSVITRGQEGTADSSHNTGGHTYRAVLSYTKFDRDTLETALATYSPIAGSSSIVTVGALASGSIAGGFTAIPDSALAKITTAGKVGGGAITDGTIGGTAVWGGASIPTTATDAKVKSLIAGSGITLSPVGGTGDVTVSSSVSGGGALVGVITSDFSTTSASYVDVTGASVAVAANSTYMLNIQFRIADPGAANIAYIKLAYPSGATMFGIGFRKADAFTLAPTTVTEALEDTSSAASGLYIVASGKFVTSSTSGNLKLQLKNGDGAETVTCYAGSGIQLVKQ